MKYQLVYQSSNYKDFPKPKVGEPGFFRKFANNRNNFELQDAKKRIRKNLHGGYNYTPSRAYFNFIQKHTVKNLSGYLWGKNI